MRRRLAIRPRTTSWSRSRASWASRSGASGASPRRRARLDAAGQLDLLGGGQQRDAADLAQVLAEQVGRRAAEHARARIGAAGRRVLGHGLRRTVIGGTPWRSRVSLAGSGGARALPGLRPARSGMRAGRLGAGPRGPRGQGPGLHGGDLQVIAAGSGAACGLGTVAAGPRSVPYVCADRRGLWPRPASTARAPMTQAPPPVWGTTHARHEGRAPTFSRTVTRCVRAITATRPGLRRDEVRGRTAREGGGTGRAGPAPGRDHERSAGGVG